MGTIFASDHSVTAPPDVGIVEAGSSLPRGLFPSYFVIFDCGGSSGGAIHWDIWQESAAFAQLQHDEHNIGTTCNQEWTYVHNFVGGADHVSILASTSSAFADWRGRFRVYYTDDPAYSAGNPLVGGSGAPTLIACDVCGKLDEILSAVKRTYSNA